MSVDISVSITEDVVDIIATPTVNIVNVTNSASINPGLYDLSQFTNTSINPFVRTSGLSAYVPTTRTISTTAPLTGGGNLSADRTLSIPMATTLVDGYLSAADWTIFNGKQNALGFTPVPTSRTLTINGTTQDLSADRTFTVSTGITIGTTAITSGTVGRVLFEGTGNVVQESANLFWDNTNGRLGIGTSSPANTIDLIGTRIRHNGTASATAVSTIYELNDTSSANKSYLLFGIDTTGGVVGTGISGTYISGGRENLGASRDINIHNYLPSHINFWTNNTQRLRIFGSTGNIGINTTTDAGYKLDVNGTARVKGDFIDLDSTNNERFKITDNASAGNSYTFLRRFDNTKDIFHVIFPSGTLTTSNVNWNFGIKGNTNNFSIASYDGGASATERFVITNTGNVLIGTSTNGASRLRVVGLPTSSAGLSSGDIWNDAGTLKIV